ncbi:phospholipid/cholesterol/gamma-HCH transport system permease protein [Formivibrio citricus]|uniref:Phospholipid/cholesterol/gamma-HCH transport system permease protein n=1 Tax=Formivibrio citricus TaxID=83765 RepID=A0A1I5ARP2_9NEIS|nr:MlaE family lipid ABC transporter permease subunit [Formivibrio citricus]SFN65105.1 phospholipid/cholesterol/gamma-HCH transport system permease protein [Formivibrio citricus]
MDTTPPFASLDACPPGSDADFALSGRLELSTVSALWQETRQRIAGPTRIDASKVSACDGAGAALLFDLHRQGARIAGLRPEFQRLLDSLEPDKPFAPGKLAHRKPLLIRAGQFLHDWLLELRQQITFTGAIAADLADLVRHPRNLRWQDFLRQCELTGANALPIISLIAFLIGVILAFQSALPLRQFGAEIFVANLLGLSLVREMGPLITAILLAGRTGAAFAAEIGTMKVNEEVNALTTFGFDPVRFLVLPRLLAGLLMAPLLTACAEIVGLVAGALVLEGFGIPFNTFFHQVASSTNLADFVGGMVKAAVFGLEIAAIGCLRGLATGAGASAVGSSTTRAVVQTLVILVVTDGLFAMLYYYLKI